MRCNILWMLRGDPIFTKCLLSGVKARRCSAKGYGFPRGQKVFLV